MRKLLTILLFMLAVCCVKASDDVAVVPGGQYVLRNVATGSYLMKDGTTTPLESEATNWRVVTNDTIFTTSKEELYYVHSDETIMQITNSGLGFKVNFSPKANTTYIMPSETTAGAFKFRYRYLASTRFLNVEVDGDGNETLTAAKTESAYNDWEFVPTSHPKAYTYRIWSMDRSSGDTEYCIAYRSHDPKGNEVWLSGWMDVPTKSEGGATNADHVLFSTHYTMSKSSQYPSASAPVESHSINLGSSKPVMVAPDYLGCGITENYDHPYCAADIMAEECVDMLLAVHDMLRDMHEKDCSASPMPTYGIGASQGGSIIIACQRYVENSPKISDEQRAAINWIRTVACAGPYDLFATMSHYYYVGGLSEASVIPMLVIGMVCGFPDVFGDTKAEDYFSDELLEAGIFDMIRSHKYDTTELADAINKACGKNIHGMLSEAAKDLNSDISQKLLKACGMCNLTRDWKPKADILLLYNPNDDVVPHLNFVSFVNGMQDNCQGKLETRKSTVTTSHIAACADFFARMILGGYK